ncbi:MAG: hypothetical protein QOG53_1402 [Frankiales bacterium]|jgi:coenzyme F420 biosynthesis associated uncharacterized protein|nr:hypothetical protein [Frankiales bacterium]
MATEFVDWDLALTTARRLVPPGPRVTSADATAIVTELHELAVEAETHVRSYTGLAADRAPGPPAVVDRPGWIANNIEGFRYVLSPLLTKLSDKRGASTGGWFMNNVGSRVTGAELGAVLAYLGSRVLGQYEVFLPPEAGEGRLSLVAPNILATERALDVNARDFRLWVCLHESTHRTQFVAVPWMRDHLMTEVSALVDTTDLDPAAMMQRMRGLAGSLRGSNGGLSLIEAIQTPEQRLVLDRITALMSLLEGHAEHVMDAVGPEVVPSVATIRKRFNQRRAGGNVVHKVLRRLLGIDLKLKQYADGSRFVNAVVSEAGQDAFNRVWEGPETLPTRAEIADPDQWMARVLGLRTAASA